MVSLLLFLQVPQAIKDHYECPPVTLLPDHIRKMQEPVPLYSLPQNPPSVEDQEEVSTALAQNINLETAVTIC